VTNKEVEEIKQHFDQRFSVLVARIDAQGARIEEQGARIESARREAGIAAEGLRAEIRQVTDGVALANERIDAVDLRVDRLATEMRRRFADVRSEIRRLHEADDRLADADEDLRRRVDRLESDRQP